VVLQKQPPYAVLSLPWFMSSNHSPLPLPALTSLVSNRCFWTKSLTSGLWRGRPDNGRERGRIVSLFQCAHIMEREEKGAEGKTSPGGSFSHPPSPSSEKRSSQSLLDPCPRRQASTDWSQHVLVDRVRRNSSPGEWQPLSTFKKLQG